MSGSDDESGRPPHTMAMGAGREFDAIRELIAVWGERARGIGDDAAVLDAADGERIVVTTDAAVEGVHFRRDWMTPAEIGWRAAVAAASDLAAMGARPLGIVIAIGLPLRWRGELAALAGGIGAACERFGIPIVGGNLSAAGELSITCTVIGGAAKPVPRNGARPGDAVYVTGRLGGPLAALKALERGESPGTSVRERLVHPSPRIDEARWLAERGTHAMIDISDGLAADAGHLAAASEVRVVIQTERIPVFGGVDPLDAARGGEEYELLVSAPELDEGAEAQFERRFGIPLTRIGSVEAGPAEMVLLRGGVRVASPPGHDHLSR